MIAYSSREFLISLPPRRRGFLRARERVREGGSAFHGQFALNALKRLPLASRCRPVRGPFPPFGLIFAPVRLFIQRAKRAAVWGAGGGNSRGLSAISSQAVALGNI